MSGVGAGAQSRAKWESNTARPHTGACDGAIDGQSREVSGRPSRDSSDAECGALDIPAGESGSKERCAPCSEARVPTVL